MKKRLILFALLVIFGYVSTQSQNWHLKGNKMTGIGIPTGWGGESVDISSKGDIFGVGLPKFISGNYVPGNVRVYKWNSHEWIQMGSDILGDTSRRNFGESLSMTPSGHTIVIGSSTIGNPSWPTGYVKVFDWNGMDWVQRGATLISGYSEDEFGKKVDINSSGTRIVVSNPLAQNFKGVVKTYDWDGVNWIESLDPIWGSLSFNQFGDFLDLSESGNELIISATSGRYTKIFQCDSNQWNQLGNTISYTGGTWPYFSPVGINASGDQIIIGYSQPGYTAFANNYSLIDTLWTLKGDTIFGNNTDENFGESVSMNWDGSFIAISAPENGPLSTGEVRLFKWEADHWEPRGNIHGDLLNEHIGISLALDSIGNTIAMSGFGEANTDEGNVQVQVLVNHLFTQNEVACDSFFWNISQNTLYQSNTYYTTVMNSDILCDSMWTLELEIVTINNQIETITDSNFTYIYSLEEQGDFSRWLDCDNNMTEFPDWNSSSIFYPPYSGSFAIEITKNGCMDTSDCDSAIVIMTSVTSLDKVSLFTITNSMGNIYFGTEVALVRIDVFDILGKNLQSSIFQNISKIEFELPEANGLYFVKISSNNKSFETIKFQILK